MQEFIANFIAISIIVILLYLAIKPIIKTKKENGSISKCYRCPYSNAKGCSINKERTDCK